MHISENLTQSHQTFQYQKTSLGQSISGSRKSGQKIFSCYVFLVD